MTHFPRSILLVDDSPAVRAIAARVLKGAGHSVLTAGTVEEAAWLLSYSSVDLVIAEATLPDGSGTDLLQVIGAPGFLLTSSYPREELRDRGLRLGSSSFLPKPFTPAELLQIVSTLLEEDADKRVMV